MQVNVTHHGEVHMLVVLEGIQELDDPIRINRAQYLPLVAYVIHLRYALITSYSDLKRTTPMVTIKSIA